MKNIIQIILLIALIIWLLTLTSCAKVKECGKVEFIKEKYSLDKKKIGEEVTWKSNGVICGNEFEKYQRLEKKEREFIKVCVNGETIGYEKNIVWTE